MDNYLFDDEIYELSDAAVKMQEITDMLKESVKQEVKDEIERLRKENTVLQEYKKHQEENDEKLARELSKLEKERRNLESKIKKARIKELLGDYIVTAWVVQRIYTEKPKCNRCNEKRELVFKSPRGREYYESCECSEPIVSYNPQATELISIKTREDRGDVLYTRTYFIAPTIYQTSREIEDSFERTSRVYNGEAYEDIDGFYSTSIVFLEKSKCQDFCDYLNHKEQEKDNAKLMQN